MRLILASRSPRRKEILAELVKDFEIIPACKEEKVDLRLPPDEIVKKLAAEKAEEVFFENSDAVVIGSDTIVYFNGTVLGKPKNEADAHRMLAVLNGQAHEVYTGVCIRTPQKNETFYCSTRVYFKTLSENFIHEYVATGSPLDKAGSYGVQDAMNPVRRYEGSFTNVMGLPSEALREKLTEMGIIE